MAETLQERLRSATGDIHQTMWEAADALDAKDAEIARLTAERDEAFNEGAEAARKRAWILLNRSGDTAVRKTAKDISTALRQLKREDTPCAPI